MAAPERHGLELRSVSKFYGTLAAVDDVSLTIEPGQFLTLLGPSGSGKTTILMSIAGFVQPSRGDILLDGKVITGLPAEKRNFGMVFQGYALFPNMTVGQNVAFPLKVRGLDASETERRVASALELVQMDHLAARMPNEISGGQQQRVALARALVFEPDLMLLDEPLSALDRKLRAELQWELKSLHERVGMTFIYVTHDQDEALSMSDEIVILRDGKIVQQGTPHDLYDRPASRFVANFLGGSNFLSGKFEKGDAKGFRYRAGGKPFVQAGKANGLKADQDVLIALSPEKIVLFEKAPKGEKNLVEGKISSFNYYGNSFHFQVETAPLGRVEVKTPAWRCTVEPVVGDRVWLAWSPEASIPVVDD